MHDILAGEADDLVRCQRGDDIIELHGYGLRALDETGTVFGTVPQFFLEP